MLLPVEIQPVTLTARQWNLKPVAVQVAVDVVTSERRRDVDTPRPGVDGEEALVE